MEERTIKRQRRVIAILVIVLILLLLAAALWYFRCAYVRSAGGSGVAGVVTDGWEPGVAAPGGESGGTQIPGYSSARMTAGDETLKISIGNPKDNQVGMYASLILGDGTVLYESGLMLPGQGLREIPLSETLAEGVYEAMVLYQCVALDDCETPLNAAESGFTLFVDAPEE